MSKNPRTYPDTMISAETGRPMIRGEKLLTISIDGQPYQYRQPGWWCSLTDPRDEEGQLVDEDNQIAEMARRTAESIARGEAFPPILIRAIRLRCGLSQRDAGELFGTGEKSFEKYEAGQIKPSKPTQKLLKFAMDKPQLFSKPAKHMPGVLDNDTILIKKTMKEARLDGIYERLFEARDNIIGP